MGRRAILNPWSAAQSRDDDRESRELGQVFATITVTNSADIDAGLVEPRSIMLTDVLLDSGATHLCLPASVIGQLGLALAREVSVHTATGFSERRIFRNALVRFEDCGRDG